MTTSKHKSGAETMLALVAKDIATLKKALALTIAISVFLAGIGTVRDAVLIIPLLCAIMALMLVSISLAYDEKADFQKFLFSMPVKKSSYVLSKLFFAVAFGAVGAIGMVLLLEIKYAAPNKTSLLAGVVTLLGCIFFSALQLPFSLKYGTVKGRVVFILTYFAVFGLCSLLKDRQDLLRKMAGLFPAQSIAWGIAAAFAIGIVLIGLLVKASTVILEKKEF